MNTAKEVKCIGRFFFRSKTVDGEFCKTWCWVFDNGVTNINQLILSNRRRIPQFKKLYTKFGKSLFLKAMGLKYGSLRAIMVGVDRALLKHKPPLENIC